MTIREYLKNPYGKGSAFSNSTKQKEELDKQFIEISKDILSRIYRYRDFVIYHVVIPSTKKDSVKYDVVVEVEAKNLSDSATDIEDIPFKVFSNCPSFIFTHAHVFRTNNLLCEWLVPKYNKEVRTNAPSERNPYGIVGLERSIYLAFKHLHSSGQTKVSVYKTTGKKVSGRTEIINSVRTQQQIMDKVREKIPANKNQETVAGKNEPTFGRKSIATTNTPSSKQVQRTVLTKTTKQVKEIKKSKATKSTKTTKTI